MLQLPRDIAPQGWWWSDEAESWLIVIIIIVIVIQHSTITPPVFVHLAIVDLLHSYITNFDSSYFKCPLPRNFHLLVHCHKFKFSQTKIMKIVPSLCYVGRQKIFSPQNFRSKSLKHSHDHKSNYHEIPAHKKHWFHVSSQVVSNYWNHNEW